MKKTEQKNTTLFLRRNLLKTAAAGFFAMIAAPTLLTLRSAHAAAFNENSKVAIVYYSRSGNTRNMATMIQTSMGRSDMIGLQTRDPYPIAYRATTEQAKKELESGYLPPLKNATQNLEAYDIVFVGSPNWWGTVAMPVMTFLSENNLAGKTVVPFITHEGTGLGRSVADITKFCPNATILEGLAVRGSRVEKSQNVINTWIKDIGLTNTQ